MSLVEKIKNSSFPIVIFGAGIAGKFTLDFCKKNNIEVEGFCDNNQNKREKLFYGLKVNSLLQINHKHKNVLFLISNLDINDTVQQLKLYGFNYWMSCNEILKDVNDRIVSNMIVSHDNYLNQDILFIRGIDIIITEKCSLKCKDCSNLMNYYEKPKNCDTKILNQEIKNFCLIVDKIGEVRIIGGEPFMNKDVHLIVQPLLTNDKINQIVIYTNGTFLPTIKQLEVFKHSKVSFYISNYGNLSKKFSQLCELLTKENIPFVVPEMRWTECSIIAQFNRTVEENQKVFDDCCVKNLLTLSNNKLYRCPFFANADRLRAIPDFLDEYINLSYNPTKNEIKKYLLDTCYLHACEFCAGRAFYDKEIEAAIQTKQPISYIKYSE
jgi:organic radical activating enzyme